MLLKTTKTSYVLTLFYSLTVWRRKRDNRRLRESYRWDTLTWRTSCDLRLEEVVTSRTKLLQYWARRTCNYLCGHNFETIPTRKKVHSTDYPQTSQIPLRPRRRNSKNNISKNYEMGDSADGFWLRIEIYTRRTDPQRWCFEQDRLWRRWWQWSILLCSWQYLLRPIRPGDQVRHQNWAGTEFTLSRCHRTNKKRHLEIVLRSRERIWTTERRLGHSQWSHLSRSCDFHSTQTKTHCDGQSSWDSPRQKCNWNISQMMAWWPASVKMFFDMLVNVRNAKKTGLAWGKQYLLGRKLKFGKDSTWTGATLRIKVIS